MHEKDQKSEAVSYTHLKDQTKFCKHLSQNKVVTIPNMAIAKEDFKLDLTSKTIIAVGLSLIHI